jgi:hypothetical protein
VSASSPSPATTTASKSKFVKFLLSIKSEFHFDRFSLSFERNTLYQKNPEEILECFHSCMWPFCNRLVYLIYRIGIAVYYSIWFVESIVRNYEFRAKNMKILTVDQRKSLLLHPWPFYMTSWSLTLLFIHLWLSAFIVLYFYSIEKSSCFTSIFSFLFGPFSCTSRSASTTRRNKKNQTCSHTPTGLEKINLFTSHPTETDTTTTTTTTTKTTPLEESPIGETRINLETTTTTTITLDELERLEKTYCSNKSKCNLHSSRLVDTSCHVWINAHVPTFILILIKVSWLLYNLIVISAILVTIGYFAYVNLNGLKMEPTWITEIGNLHRHGVNSLVALIDVFLMAYPVRIFHFVYTTFYGWTYALVVFIYYVQDTKKNLIYEQIDYNKPLMIVFYYVTLSILTFFLQLLHYLAYRLKLYLKRKYLEFRIKCFK